MNNNALRVIVMMSMLTLGLGIAAGQGLYWESVTKISAANGQEMNASSYYLPHMLKQSSERIAIVFRLDKEMIYQINSEAKEYSEMTFKEMEGFAKRTGDEMQKRMEEMKKQMESLPAEQRKSMEEMMGGQGMGGDPNAKVDVTKTNEKKNVAGYSCVKYLLKEDGKEFGSIWTTTGVPGFSSMQKDMKEFSSRMAAQMSFRGGKLAAAMGNLDGFPMETTIGGMSTTVTKVEKKAIAASEFEIPSGYTKVSPEELMGKGANQEP